MMEEKWGLEPNSTFFFLFFLLNFVFCDLRFDLRNLEEDMEEGGGGGGGGREEMEWPDELQLLAASLVIFNHHGEVMFFLSNIPSSAASSGVT